MILSKLNSICLFMLFMSAQSSLFMNPLRKTFSTGTIKYVSMQTIRWYWDWERMLNLLFTAIDTSLIYEGLFLPENNLIVIIQNFYVWAVSSLGLLALIPFYQVRKTFAQCCNVMGNVKCHAHQAPTATGRTIQNQGRSFDEDYDYYGSGPEDFQWISSQTMTDMSWMLRYIADWMDNYNNVWVWADRYYTFCDILFNLLIYIDKI